MIGTEKSHCKEGWLHRFTILRQSPNGVEEGCIICKEKRVFKIIEGRINNLEYLEYHIRQALPKWHPLFKREYPNAR